MPTQAISARPDIDVAGMPMPPELLTQLVSVVVDSSLHQPDLFVLTFRDSGRLVLSGTGIAVGARVRITLRAGAESGGAPLTSGEVTAVEAEGDSSGTFTIVRGYDVSHRLMRGRRTHAYKDARVSDVVTQVAARAGVTSVRVQPTGAVRAHIVQHDQTDWEFLQGLAREVGNELVVADGTLELRPPVDSGDGPTVGRSDSQSPLQLVLGDNLLRFRSTINASEQVKDVEVRGWDPKAKRELIGRAPARTTDVEVGTTPAQLAALFGDHTLVSAGVPHGAGEVDQVAKALAAVVAGSFAELEGTARGNPHLRAGTPVSIGKLGAPFDGKYTLTACRHTYDPETGYTVSFNASGRADRSLTGLASGDTVIPAEGVWARGDGRSSAIAIVTNCNDPEQLARVKLKFPWLSDDYESDWARVVHPGAGLDRGSVFMPEVGDEVLVVFEHGDPRRPFVVGGLFNGEDTPKLGDAFIGGDGSVTRRGMLSRKGHGVLFFDGDGDEGLAVMSGGGGLRISLNDSQTTIKVTSSGKVEITGTTDVVVDAGANLTLKAGASASLEATGTLDLKGAMVNVEGTGPVTVKGAVIQLN